jgi:hypothetical protein
MAKVTTDGLGIRLRGKAGNVVFMQTRFGVTFRPRIVPANPRTPAQTASRGRFARASAAWRTISPEQHAAWTAYARTLVRFPADGGPPTIPAPHNVFTALATKFLQANPEGSIPLDPPATPFFGDGITVTATAGTGGITFTASGPNSAGIVTELLLQPLVNVARAPIPTRYRAQEFVAFAPGGLSRAVAVPPGAWAPAVRFVRAATGQEGPLIPLPGAVVTA